MGVSKVRVVGITLERELEARAAGRTVDFILSAVGSHWKVLRKGITHFGKCFKEIILAVPQVFEPEKLHLE